MAADPDVMLLLLEQLEQRNAALEQANQDLQHFAEAAAHDLRSPLTLVRGYVEQVLHRDKSLSPQTAEWLREALRAAMQMVDLVDALLRHTMTAGGEFTTGDVPLDVVFADAVARLRHRIDGTGAAVTLGPLPTVRGDRDLLTVVAQNLLENALKFARPDTAPEVTVTGGAAAAAPTLLSRPTCVVRVQDNGVGIPPADRERVFALFARGGTPSGSGAPGTGIGLATCARIIARHHGSIRVVDGPGPGAVIEIELPTSDG